MKVTIFEFLLVNHLLMDWIFQGKYQAEKKSSEVKALISHCFIYTVGFIPIFWFLHISWYWLFILFITHLILDKRGFENWVMKMKGLNKNNVSTEVWSIVSTGVDQTLHLIVILFISIFYS